MSTEEGPVKQPAPEQTPDGFPSATRLANRYGTPKPGLSRRTKTIIGGAAVLLGCAGAAWIAAPSPGGDVTFKDVGFSIPDSGSAVIDFQVTKDRDATATCAVQALNDAYAVVGWKQITIGPAEDETTGQRVAIRTDSLGVTGGVNACWITEEP
ncbi:DUF4307 domain-containing protein [Arthrobacter sp. zg-Y1219]|uniref:DUF4307 domain-containing protein n=1 Tax=Arthrobacter sp. zg-Y1219 TaxID=3049067 RepID=UPI0024C3328C|nr:DUF4307 domain-containing protein [Arthrobacter sp. zg-Y1219]MDK1360103.1 DUF4307 domain-containing protein [Arthrobacter sp. zg-Y1219]